MKQAIFSITFSLLCCTLLFLPAAAQKKRIVAENFRDTIFEHFFKETNSITDEDLDSGFEFHVKNNLNLTDTPSIKNALSKFTEMNEKSKDVTFTVYEIKKAFKDSNGFVIIHLVKGKATKEIKIKISGQKFEPPHVNTDCLKIPAISLPKLISKCAKNFDNKFGEDVTMYDKNTIVYIYDMKTRQFYKLEKSSSKPGMLNFSTETISANKNVTLKVVNLNQFRYELTVNDSMGVFGSEPSLLFNQLFIGDSNILGGLLKSLTNGLAIAEGGNKTEDDFENLAKNITCFLRKYNELQAKMLQTYSPCTSLLCCEDIEAIDFYELANSLLDIKIQAAKMQNTINERKAALSSKKACLKLKTDLEANAKERQPIEAKAEASRTADENKNLAKLVEQQKTLEKTIKEDNKCKDDIPTLTSDIKKLDAEIESSSAIEDVFAKLPAQEALYKLVGFLNNVVQKENIYGLNTGGNFLDLTMEVKSRDSIFKYFQFPSEKILDFHREIPVVGRPFLSFSAGSFISFGLQNKTYDWQQVANPDNLVLDTAKYILTESGYTSPPMGFSALGNVEWKTSRNFGHGPSLGVGITIEKEPRPVYMLGYSAFFGEARQFALSIGAAGMQVNRLKNNFEAISEQQVRYASKPTVEYYKELRFGGFISLTYTPFSITKKR